MKVRKEFIRSMPIFSGLADNEIDLILSLTDEKKYPPGQVIVHEGDLGNLIYVIKEGEVLIEKARTQNGKPQPVTTLGQKDSFGEMSLIDPQPRAATVRAISETTLITISTKALHDIYITKPETYVMILMNLARQMSRRLRKALEVIVELQTGVREALPNLHI